MGGDKFAVALLEKTKDQAEELVSYLLDEISRPIRLAQGNAMVSATAGFAHYPDAANNAALLYERADFALCHAKQEYRGKAIEFCQEHEHKILLSSRIAKKTSGRLTSNKRLPLRFNLFGTFTRVSLLGSRPWRDGKVPSLEMCRRTNLLRSQNKLDSL